MKIIFSHGKESGPWGTKIQRLAEIAKRRGCAVDSIDYTEIEDPDLRAMKLVSILEDEEENYILVGSSMGAYVSLVAAEKIVPVSIFLLAPALYIEGFKVQEHRPLVRNVEIVHGWSDEVIPYTNSVRFAEASNASLHLIRGDHRLIDALDVVESLFELHLRRFAG